MQQKYDVAILGGGLAGLTLAIQLKQNNPAASILVLERRAGDAPLAAHKVGESTVELGTYYLREIIGIKDYLDKHELPKHGLRFFLSPKHKKELSKRVELGPRNRLPIQSHQLDRGTLENYLTEKAIELGCEVFLGAGARDVTIDKENGHAVLFDHQKEKKEIKCTWVVDAAGRTSFLKRKLGLMKEMDHDINSVWFRVKGEIEIDAWSNDQQWKGRLEPGLRRYSTVHLMDKGYWVWFIPLGTGNTSVGIVADPRFHPFEEFNKLDKAFDWLKKNEPVAYDCLIDKKDEILDFRILKKYSHHTQQVFSTDKWGTAGESGPFLDPFYSPGTDFIALNNCFLNELITKDLSGENVELQTEIFDKTHLSLVDSWIPVYLNQYHLWGRTQAMVMKIFWDWSVYWSFHTLIFTNGGFTNLSVLKNVFASETSLGQKLGVLNVRVQKLLSDFGSHDDGDFTDRYIDPFDLDYLKEFHENIETQYSSRELINKLKANLGILEQVAVQIYRKVSHKVNQTPLDIKVNPYEMELDKIDYQEGIDVPSELINDVETMWFYKEEVLN